MEYLDIAAKDLQRIYVMLEMSDLDIYTQMRITIGDDYLVADLNHAYVKLSLHWEGNVYTAEWKFYDFLEELNIPALIWELKKQIPAQTQEELELELEF